MSRLGFSKLLVHCIEMICELVKSNITRKILNISFMIKDDTFCCDILFYRL